jgi:hypothetical protein
MGGADGPGDGDADGEAADPGATEDIDVSGVSLIVSSIVRTHPEKT